MHFAAHTVVPGIGRQSAEVLRQQHVREPNAARALAAGRREERRVLLDRRRLRHPARRRSVRGHADGADQRLRHSKLMTEWMLRDVAAVNPLRYVALRYFNVAGSDPEGRIGQATPKATLLTKVACEVVVGKQTLRVDLRHRLPDAGRHRRSRLHPRRGPRGRAFEGPRLLAPRRRIHDIELRLRARLQRSRAARHGRERSPGTP